MTNNTVSYVALGLYWDYLGHVPVPTFCSNCGQTLEQAYADLVEQQANLQFMWVEREGQARAQEPKKT